MTDNVEFMDLLDKYAKGELSPEEQRSFDEKIRTDENFRKASEEHVGFLKALKLYKTRENLKNVLSHVTMESPSEEARVVPLEKLQTNLYRKYWPMTAVAASVALISIVATLLVTRSLETKQTAYYQELVRNVEQIKKSQNRLIQDIAKTAEKPAPSPGRYAGTGFLVSANGYLLTSHHVVKGADSVFIENETYGRHKAAVVYSDATNDVSILRIENLAFKRPKSLPYTISDAEANLGEAVYTLGFPREDVVFGEGSISALSGYEQNPNAYQVSVPVNPGNSGGPLFNERGDLVGIISGIQTETSGAAFAIKSSVLLSVIENLPSDTLSSPLVLPSKNSIRALGKVDKVKRWKDNVFVVRVYNSK